MFDSEQDRGAEADLSYDCEYKKDLKVVIDFKMTDIWSLHDHKLFMINEDDDLPTCGVCNKTLQEQCYAGDDPYCTGCAEGQFAREVVKAIEFAKRTYNYFGPEFSEHLTNPHFDYLYHSGFAVDYIGHRILDKCFRTEEAIQERYDAMVASGFMKKFENVYDEHGNVIDVRFNKDA